MKPAKLARECLGEEYRADTVLVVARKDGVHVGHAIVTKWGYDNGEHAASMYMLAAPCAKLTSIVILNVL